MQYGVSHPKLHVIHLIKKKLPKQKTYLGEKLTNMLCLTKSIQIHQLKRKLCESMFVNMSVI